MASDIPAPVSGGADREDELVATTLELLSFDTQNPPGDTSAIVERIRRLFEDLGLDTRRIAVEPDKPNVVATLPGERDATLLFNGHVDTVPFEPDDWSVDPLGERRGQRIYGRGATDMKGQVAAMLQTARAFVRGDASPPLTLEFAIVSDEETGGAAGLEAVVDEAELAADACVIGETTCDRGRHSVTVADRGCIWLTLRARGEAAHGSRPTLGENAIDRLYDAVSTVRDRFGRRDLPIERDVEPIIDESVDYYGPSMGADATRDLFERPTINLGTLRGGDAINVVPRAATAEVDIRLTAGVDTSAVLADVRSCLEGCDGVSIADVSWSVGSYEPIDSPLVDAIATTAHDALDERIYRRSATGGGDAKTLRRAGIPTVEFGLGTGTVHAVDEYTTLEALVGNAEVYTRLPYALDERL